MRIYSITSTTQDSDIPSGAVIVIVIITIPISLFVLAPYNRLEWASTLTAKKQN